MKKIILLLSAALILSAVGVMAQNVAYGKRAPEINPTSWLGGRQPADAEMTYIEFFDADNAACITSLEKLKALTNKLDTKLCVIVVAQEKESKVAPLLSPFLSPRITVALDTDGHIFAAYGVQYVPFGVLTDAKNRTVWLGNSLQLTEEMIENSK